MTEKRNFPVEIEPKGPWPCLIGLEGPPGSGKTFSALRIARGMQRVLAGPIVVIDTEGGRSAQYWQHIKFLLMQLDPPFRSSRFLAAVRELIANEKPAVLIIDTLSDEHEGVGGLLDYHEQEIDRFCGGSGDQRRRDAVAMPAWVKPKKERRDMINELMRIKTLPLICTFRAREKTRPVAKQKDGKTVYEPSRLGYQAIAPAEICFGMTAMCLLPPHANGVPTWRTDEAGVDFLLKRPIHMEKILTDAQLSEDTGEALARWAAGTPSRPAVHATREQPPAPQAPAPPAADEVEIAHRALANAATQGMKQLMQTWRATGKNVRDATPEDIRDRWKTIAAEVDMRSTVDE